MTTAPNISIHPRIPLWDAPRYHGSTSVQIAVRLPDDMVTFLDDAVSQGRTPSRAALVAQALEREMRRQAALDDVRILEQCGTSNDLDELVSWSARSFTLDE